MHRAVRNLCSAAVQTLLESSADPGRRNDSGSTLCAAGGPPAAVAPGRPKPRPSRRSSCSCSRMSSDANERHIGWCRSRTVGGSSSEDQAPTRNLHQAYARERGQLSRWHLLHWSSRLVARLGNLRNVVRQELISRQLADHLPSPPARILDVGAVRHASDSPGRTWYLSPRSNRMPRCVTCSPNSDQQPDASEPGSVCARPSSALAQAVDRTAPRIHTRPTRRAVLRRSDVPGVTSGGDCRARDFVAPSGYLAIAARSAHSYRGARSSPGLGRCPERVRRVESPPRRPIPTLCQRNQSPARADTIEDMTSLCEAAACTQRWYRARCHRHEMC